MGAILAETERLPCKFTLNSKRLTGCAHVLRHHHGLHSCLSGGSLQFDLMQEILEDDVIAKILSRDSSRGATMQWVIRVIGGIQLPQVTPRGSVLGYGRLPEDTR